MKLALRHQLLKSECPLLSDFYVVLPFETKVSVIKRLSAVERFYCTKYKICSNIKHT